VFLLFFVNFWSVGPFRNHTHLHYYFPSTWTDERKNISWCKNIKIYNQHLRCILYTSRMSEKGPAAYLLQLCDNLSTSNHHALLPRRILVFGVGVHLMIDYKEEYHKIQDKNTGSLPCRLGGPRWISYPLEDPAPLLVFPLSLFDSFFLLIICLLKCLWYYNYSDRRIYLKK